MGKKAGNNFKMRLSKSKAKVSDLIRLNKFIAHAGVCSRREADVLITAGRIFVNGIKVNELGIKINPLKDEVRLGTIKLTAEKKVYILLNKPKDYITTTDDPQERKIVLDLVRKASSSRIYPVGRLDRNSTGLLLLTNDGDLAGIISHPSGNVKKVYEVKIDKPLSERDYRKFLTGIDLEDGLAKVDAIAYARKGDDKTILGIELHTGKNRVIRRMFEKLGYEVIRLDRMRIAGLTKKNLPRGKWRFLTPKEVGMLKMIGKSSRNRK